MVPREEDGFTGALDAVAEIDDRVVQQIGRHRGTADLYALPRCQRHVLHTGLEFGLANREIAVLQLHRHHLLDAIARDRIEGTMQAQHVTRYEVRHEEWQALNVVPMGVRNQYVGGQRHLTQQGLRQRKDARARVQNDQFIGVSTHLDAGGIAAVTHGLRTGRGDGAANAPETDLHACLSGACE